MHDRVHGTHVICCDRCGETMQEKNYNALMMHARQGGWIMNQVDGEWTHYCDCYGDSIRGGK